MTTFKPLRDLVSFRGGGTPSKQVPEYWDGDIPWASVKDFTSTSLSKTQDFITQEGLRNSSANLIPKGHVIIPTRMSLGKAAINTVDLAINQDLRALVPRVPLDAKFLLHAVLSLKDEILKKGSGATVKGITQEELYKLEIYVPEEFGDQIHIAHLLGKVEGLIAQRKQHLQQLDELLKSVFLEMFGDPVRNDKGWESTTIGQIIKVASGNGLVAKKMNTEGPHKVYGGNGVNGTHTEYMFDSPTLVIGRVGYYCGSVHITEPKSWVTDNALYVKEFLKKTDLVFVKHLLATHDLNKAAGRAAQPLVSGSRIYPIRTIDVPFENQMVFSAIVERVEVLKSRYQQSLTDLEALYGALSQQAFKGELDLSRVGLPAAPIEGEMPVAAAVPAPISAPVIELPETELLLPALQDRTQLAPLLRFWLEAYHTQLGGVDFSLESFIATAQTRLGELHPDNDFELRASDYEVIKVWVFEALAAGALTQAFDDDGNRIELRAAAEQSLA